MINFNIFSPNEDFTFDEQPEVKLTISKETLKNMLKRPVVKESLAKATGSFEYTSTKTGASYNISIVDGYDASLLLHIMYGKLKNTNKYPVGYRKVIDLFNIAGALPEGFKEKVLQCILPWLPEIKHNKVINPITKRSIKYNKQTYKNIFKNIKLKAIDYIQPQIFKTKDYKVINNCVYDYLKTYLTKKQFCSTLPKLTKYNNQPTYPQLTRILNKLSINLNVYIIDKEQLQEQTEFKKTLNILIHNSHMYVLHACVYKKISSKEVNQNEFDNILQLTDIIQYTNSSVIHNGIKYKPKAKNTKDITSYFNSTFSNSNIMFFKGCDIRPVKYCSDKPHESGIDIDACYSNILQNPDYIYPITSGDEYTKVYNNKPIKRAYFYYITIIKPTEEQTILFKNECWVLGYVLKEMKQLNIKMKIHFMHVVKNSIKSPDFTYTKNDAIFYKTKEIKKTPDNILNVKHRDLILAVGSMAGYITRPTTTYKINDEAELNALKMKYSDDSFISEYTKDYNIIESEIKKRKEKNQDIKDLFEGEEIAETPINKAVNIRLERYKKKSALYTSLAIMSYCKLQLYIIFKTFQKMDKSLKISKVITDYIGFNKHISTKKIINANSALLHHNIKLKKQYSEYTFKHNVYEPEKVTPETREMEEHDEIEFINMLNKNVSFSIIGRGGYGKTYSIQNIIIPYLNKNNKKFILSSTTKANAEELQNKCNVITECIQQILFTKDKSLNNLVEKFKDIDYIIIDESSQMQMDVINTLEYLKTHTNLKVITSGDINQCGAMDAQGSCIKSWMNTRPFYSLVDYNTLKLTFKENSRYTKEHDTFLNDILETDGDKRKIKKVLIGYFGKTQIIDFKKYDSNKINITYSNKYGRENFSQSKKNKSITEDKTEYSSHWITVHAIQGKSIEEPHNIHEFMNMTLNVLYTALSRTTKKEYINLIYKNIS
jgi:hypothetical protein